MQSDEIFRSSNSNEKENDSIFMRSPLSNASQTTKGKVIRLVGNGNWRKAGVPMANDHAIQAPSQISDARSSTIQNRPGFVQLLTEESDSQKREAGIENESQAADRRRHENSQVAIQVQQSPDSENLKSEPLFTAAAPADPYSNTNDNNVNDNEELKA